MILTKEGKMDIDLTLNETRVIGSLIEKEITTPDQYPLSLNGLTNACNQKSNRAPVLELDEDTVQETLDQLIKKHLVGVVSSLGSRVVKYSHRFCNTEVDKLHFTQQELGIICVLLLRGPQTPGELRTKSNRLCSFDNVMEVESVLKQLIGRDDGPFVVKLSREPGKKESRYAHLFSDREEPCDLFENQSVKQTESSVDNDRIKDLEIKVNAMRDEIDQLKMKFEELI